jgi:hypothetical protein
LPKGFSAAVVEHSIAVKVVEWHAQNLKWEDMDKVMKPQPEVRRAWLEAPCLHRQLLSVTWANMWRSRSRPSSWLTYRTRSASMCFKSSSAKAASHRWAQDDVYTCPFPYLPRPAS